MPLDPHRPYSADPATLHYTGHTGTVSSAPGATGVNVDTADGRWYFIEERCRPPAIDRAAAKAQRLLIYEETTRFRLVQSIEPKELLKLRARFLGWNGSMITSVLTALEEFPSLIGAPLAAEIRLLAGDNDSLNQLALAHDTLSQQHRETLTLRGYALFALIDELMTDLGERHQAGVRTGTLDPMLTAAYKRITDVVQATKDKNGSVQDRVRRAYTEGQEEARGEGDKKDDEIRFLRSQVERMTAEMQQLRLSMAEKAAPPAPGITGRRQSSR